MPMTSLLLFVIILLSIVMTVTSIEGLEDNHIDPCRDLDSCVLCTENNHKCAWTRSHHQRSHEYSCSLRSLEHNDETKELIFDDTCPVDYGMKNDFLANWMGELMSVLGDSSLLDLSLPGTHDTLTYDLSTTVSEGGIEEFYKLAELLHNKTDIIPDFIEDFMRSGAQTQDLTITQQLDAGIRFLDVRMMLEYTDDTPEWYSLHMMQSRDLSIKYFHDIRSWMDAHPTEVVVMWLSKHGNECATGQDQYPNVSVEQKQNFWHEILSIFEGITVDFSQSNLNETSLKTLVERGHRAVFYVADFVEMTGYVDGDGTNPTYALDSCLIDNQLGNPAGPSAVDHQRELYLSANERKASDKKNQRLYLVSLVGGMNYVYATLLKFGILDKLPKDDSELVAECAKSFNTPGMNWCPETLLDGSQLANYYTQVAMDDVVNRMLAGDYSYGLPHAIYINAVGSLEGTIRTGTEVLWGKNRSPDGTHAVTEFSYVDSFVLYNVLNVCKVIRNERPEIFSDCDYYTDLIVQRRSKNPLALWDDATYGRLISW